MAENNGERLSIQSLKLTGGRIMLIIVCAFLEEIPHRSRRLFHSYLVGAAWFRTYFDKLKAPVKGFYTFEQSAHSPLFEEPEKMMQILKEDVLVGSNNMANY